MIALALTGYGAVAEALGFALLAVGAAFSGTDLLKGIAGLVKFFTTVDGERPEDLREAFRGRGGEDRGGRPVLRAVNVRAKEGLRKARGKDNCRQHPQFREVDMEEF